jgi:L-ribulose-5-phosphate 4-epimerase
MSQRDDDTKRRSEAMTTTTGLHATQPGQLALASDLLEAAKLLFTAGVMSHSGHANLSARLDERHFLLTTTGTVRDLHADQLGVVDFDGNLLEGDLAPDRAEIIAMHSVVYTTRPDVGAVFHTHSPSVTAFALADRPLPSRIEALLRFGQADPIPVVPWGPRGSYISVRGITKTLDEHPTTTAVLLANHGLLAFGADPLAATDLVIALEEAAEAELAATMLGGGVDLPQDALHAVQASMQRAQSSPTRLETQQLMHGS